MINIEQVKTAVLDLLSKHLSEKLTYHSIGHTTDVVKQALHIADCEGIRDEENLVLLETAAWFHDTGFTKVYRGHEAESCRIAMQMLPALGASDDEITRVLELIMATKVPQSPPNFLAKILCDADLDYLGRHDFHEIAALLQKELITFDLLTPEYPFNNSQIQFLNQHHYFTNYSRHHREPVKRLYLDDLRNLTND